MTVGLFRSVDILFSPKGTRALIKVYTDIKLDAENPRVWYGMGLEPVIGLVRSTSDSKYDAMSLCEKRKKGVFADSTLLFHQHTHNCSLLNAETWELIREQYQSFIGA